MAKRKQDLNGPDVVRMLDVELAPRRPRRGNPNFRFADLFAGIGGMRLAMSRNGGQCVFSSDWDSFAQATYEANFGERPFGDITQIHESAIPRFDVLTAGFPCQPFSSIGKREGFAHKTQGTLFYDVLRIMREHRPKAVLLENVTGLITHNGGDTYQTILSALEELDYLPRARILNAADYGVPQFRERIYIVAFDRRALATKGLDRPNFGWPRPSRKHVSIGQFIESGVDGYSISKHLQHVYIKKKSDGNPEIVGPETDHPVKTLVASYHKIQRITGTFVADGPTGLRLLTPNECKAIMGFPKSFKFPVSRTQIYRQLGNSVAVPVVQKIAYQVVQALVDADLLTVEPRVAPLRRGRRTGAAT